MNFTSLQYMIFFVIACVVYFLLNKKVRNYWLLICSYYFYMCWNPKYALLMLFSTFITYLSGILIGKSKTTKQKKICVALSFIINLGILFLFKYYGFILDSLNAILNPLFSLTIPKTLDLLLPIGISFYTFQALSYTMDVYRKDVKIEKNFFKYALFVSFFPQLVAGPIEKSKDLLDQFNHEHKFNWDNLHKGLLLIAIGFFYKLVIADRAAIVVNQIYNNLGNYTNGGGLYLIIATVLFAIQIYFDFNAYSTIAKGSAKVLGYELSTNFNKPYISTSIKDFWKRWHISLTSWFREYLYFPLGGSRKGFVRTQINILIVFLVSGMWHGAAWTFFIWGLLHAIYQIIENIIAKYKKPTKNTLPKTIIKMITTFILVTFAWIFFRANTVSDAFTIIGNLFDFGMVIDLSLLGTTILELIILLVSFLIVYILELLSTKYDISKIFYERNIIIRWIFYYILIFTIIIFGIYGPGFDATEFIYFQF
ncbi:MAG: MBOAT family O-acyltransferase [Candidatus Coprovivens sp.]